MNTRRPALIGAILALTTLAACGGPSDDDVASLADTDAPAGTSADRSDTDDATATPEEAAIEFASCMRDEGIDMPDPEIAENGGVTFQQREVKDDGGPSLTDRDAMEAAFDACGHIMENAGLGPGDATDRAEMEDEVLEFTQCMRDEGVELDDPDFDSPVDASAGPAEGSGTGPIIGGPFGTLDLGDPDVAAAFEECRGIMEDMGMPDVPPPAAEGDG